MFNPWSGKISHAVEQLSPLTATTEPEELRAAAAEARAPRARALQEKPLQWEAHAHHS